MKGQALVYGGILVVAVLTSLVLARMNNGINIERSVITVEGKIVSFENYVELLMRTFNQSIEFNAQRSAYELGEIGGGSNFLWTSTYPQITDLEKNLENKIISNSPSGDYSDESKEILWGEGEIKVDKYDDPLTCGPIKSSKCFYAEGSKYLSVDDNSINSRISVTNKINSKISSSYFRLLYVGRQILEDATLRSKLNDIPTLLNLLKTRFPNLEFEIDLNPNLVGYWNFDEGSGNAVHDYSGLGNNGILGNGACNPGTGNCPTWIDGKYGKALSFNGVYNLVDVPQSNSLKLNTFSAETWFKVNQFPGSNPNIPWETLIQKDWSNYGFWLGIQNGTDSGVSPPSHTNALVFSTIGDSGRVTLFSADNALKTNVWYFVVATYDGSNIKLFLNGQEIDEKPQTGITNIPGDMIIGFQAGGNSAFNGTIDEVKIYNRALSEDEIQKEYETPPNSNILGVTITDKSCMDASCSSTDYYCIAPLKPGEEGITCGGKQIPYDYLKLKFRVNANAQGASLPQNFDFNVNINSNSNSTTPGKSVQQSVNVILSGSPTKQVDLSYSITPNEPTITMSLTPSSGTPSYPSVMNVQTTSATSPRNYLIKVVGTGGGLTREADFTLTVNPTSCSCTPWINGACNVGNCVNQRQQTRTCTPSSCDVTSQCIADSSCNPKCSDGTPYGQCNTTNQPKYCNNGNLIDNCTFCQCPSGQTCNSGTGACNIPPLFTYSLSLNSTSGTATEGVATTKTIKITVTKNDHSILSKIVGFSSGIVPPTSSISMAGFVACIPSDAPPYQCNSTFTISTTSSTPSYIYKISIGGVSAPGTSVDGTTYNLTVNSPPPCDGTVALTCATPPVDRPGFDTRNLTGNCGRTNAKIDCDGVTNSHHVCNSNACNPIEPAIGSYSVSQSNINVGDSFSLSVNGNCPANLPGNCLVECEVTHPNGHNITLDAWNKNGVVTMPSTTCDQAGTYKVDYCGVFTDFKANSGWGLINNTGTAISCSLFSFAISVKPTNDNIVQGASITKTITINITKTNGNSRPVSLSISGSIPGISISQPTPLSCTPTNNCTSNFTISGIPTSIGTYLINVTGSSGTFTSTTNYTLTVNTPFTFFVSVIPTSNNVIVEDSFSKTVTINVTRMSGTSQSVSLSTIGSISGISISQPSPLSCTPNCTSMFSISGTPTSIGTYSVIANGTSGGLSVAAKYNLTVNPGCKCSDGITDCNSCARTDANKPSWCDSSGNWVTNQCSAHGCGCPTCLPPYTDCTGCQSDGSCSSFNFKLTAIPATNTTELNKPFYQVVNVIVTKINPDNPSQPPTASSQSVSFLSNIWYIPGIYVQHPPSSSCTPSNSPPYQCIMNYILSGAPLALAGTPGIFNELVFSASSGSISDTTSYYLNVVP